MTDTIKTWAEIPAGEPRTGDGGLRKRLPDTRPALTRKVTVGGLDVYINVAFHPGSCVPGELFIKIGKIGSDIGGMFDALSSVISVAIQYGMPWPQVVEKMKRYRFGMDPTDECPSILHAVIVAADGLVREYAHRGKP